MVAAEARGKAILDIRVGAGRTVPALLAIRPDYLGIDSSQQMITACRERFPYQRFSHVDARRMVSIADGSFVFTTYNRNSPEAKAGFRFPELMPSYNPARALVRAFRWVRDIVISATQRSRSLRHEVHATHFTCSTTAATTTA